MLRRNAPFSHSVFLEAVIARSTRWLTRPRAQSRYHPDVAHQIPASLLLPASAAPPSFSSTSSRRRRLVLQTRTEKKTTKEGKWRACSHLFCYEGGEILMHDTLCYRSGIRFGSSHTPLGPLPCRCARTDCRPAEKKAHRLCHRGLDEKMKPVFWSSSGHCSESWIFVFFMYAVQKSSVFSDFLLKIK